MKYFYKFFLLAFCLIISDISEAQITRDDCYMCHSNPTLQKEITTSDGVEIIPLYVDSTQYNQSLHNALECVQCHTDINSGNLTNHNLDKYYGSWARLSKSDTTLNGDGSPRTRNYYTAASLSCKQSGCHESHSDYESTNHFEIFKLKAANVHFVNGESVGENYDKSCSRCHSTCATCHFESTLIQKYPGDLTAIWDSLHAYGEGLFPNASAMSEWSMDWTTNVVSHNFRTSNNLKSNNDVCRSCHVGYYRPPVEGFITEEPPYTKSKGTNIKRHPQFYEALLSSTHLTLQCADCHTGVHSYPGRKYDWQIEGDIICQSCHQMTDHYAQHTSVDCISCHATGFGRSAGLGDDVHDVFRWTENNRVRPFAVKYNEGLSWYPHNIEKPDPVTSCAAKCHYEGNLVGATVTSVFEISNDIPVQYSLEQNYPNPFNPTTEIKFSLPKEQYVSLKVYDALGKEIETLVDNQLLKTGTYSTSFNAKDYSSGIYFYQLKTGSYSAVKKMILIK